MSLQSSHNPFRNPSGPSTPPAVIPNTTGTTHSYTSNSKDASNQSLKRQGALNSDAPMSSTSIATTSTTTPATSSSEASPTTSNSTSQNTASNNSTTPGVRHRIDPLDIPEDDPPAYTPGPDVRHGEATVEYGPSRPFQPPPQPPSQQPPISQQRPPQHPGWPAVQNHAPPPSRPSQAPTLLQQITGNLADRLNNLSTGGGSYNYNRYQGFPGNFGSPSPAGYPPPSGPPPGHLPPQNITPSQQYPPPSHSPLSHPSPVSDFSRDFYAAGAGPNPQSNQGDAALSTASADSSATTGPSGQQSTPSASANDGRPTQIPTPGHPLLNDGKLLVYPAGFVCKKCHNIGYKDADPKRPCKKCWPKYAKPFSGALSYSDFSSNASTGSGSTFQKPLPMRTQAQNHSGPGLSSGYPGATHHQQYYHQNHPPPPPPPPPLPHRPSYGPYVPPPQHPSIVLASPGYLPRAPGAIVYQPGDPRIGGQLCWRCGGDGLVDMLFWEDRCDTCGGTGRIFR
ncbi:hypothetical protein L218DRAFT_955985 [Marasmius fiardii PR-910]|nr:hypothetical protein L218DRAFT_955985 [Marasmius fiardii PR-910]